ncbi:hypothetical protein [Ottowia thiooxydans]|uniref:hypothetical protein n=1 Tax=Ottowia thiooxydans TaxID=219182 RepID=UPI0004293877|nr:hypothetical protein [Ottowia thiooxydans]
MNQVTAESPAAERRTARAAWVLFAPPFAVAALQWWLATLSQKDTTPLQALRAAGASHESGVGSLMLQASGPFLWMVAVLVLTVLVARWSWRRYGGPRVIRVAAVLWVLMCAAALLAVGYAYLNRMGREAAPARTAIVIQARTQTASERSPGGAVVLARVPGLEAPQSVLLEEADAARLPAGTPVTLSLAQGRFSGLYVTDWRIEAPLATPTR